MEKLGRYEILETLGTGSMGVVYRARDTLLYREIALKTIGTGPTVDAELRERFYREARACALLQHPNIVTVFDLGEADNMAYIVMELLQGEDLKRLIDDRRAIPLETRVELMVQVCEAMAHAHQSGVIHRDIKPSNIFVERGNRAKVLDFGIARLPSSKLTIVGRVLGTPNYMAPEQILGQGCDARSDLFSAAVVFFEFAAGVHPFRASFIPGRIVDGKPDRLRDVDAAMPYALEQALGRALEKEPEKRYANGERFAAELKNALAEIRAANPEPRPSVGAIAVAPDRGVTAGQPPEPDPAFGSAPPGEQSSEWRVSEFLRLLHEFDTAAAQGDLQGVRKAFVYMKKLESKDQRFATAATEYGNRLLELEDRIGTARPKTEPRPAVTPAPAPVAKSPEPRPPRPAPPRVTPPPTAPPAPPSQPAAARQHDTVSEKTLPVSVPPPRRMTMDAATVIFEKPAVDDLSEPPVTVPTAPAPRLRPQAVAPPPPPPAPAVVPAAAPAPVSRPLPVPQPRQTKAEDKVIRVAIAFVAVLAVAALGYWLLARGEEALPAVGTAEVVAAKAAVYEVPSARKPIYPLAAGEKVNVVRLPRSQRPDWVRVQLVSGRKVSAPGFARSDTLGNWSTFALLSMFRPDEGASPQELEAYVKSLEKLAAQSPAGSRPPIWLETAEQSLVLARAVRQAGGRPEEWLEHASRALDAIPNDSDLRGRRDEMRKALRSAR
jgi:eukaryotic-like serine/threonine-protein kinase